MTLLEENASSDFGSSSPPPHVPRRSRLLAGLQAPWVAYVLIFLIALAPRLGYFRIRAQSAALSPDEGHYLKSAAVLWQHHVYGSKPGEPFARDHILYVLFLSPFVGLWGSRPVTAMIFQCLLSAGCACFVFALGRRLAGRFAGWVAGLFCASYLPLVAYSSLYLTEVLTTFFLLLGMLISDRVLAKPEAKGSRVYAFVLGGVFAGMALTRLITLPLILIPLVLLLFSLRKRLRPGLSLAALSLAGFLLCYSPWVIRNIAVFHQPLPLGTSSEKITALGDDRIWLLLQGKEALSSKEVSEMIREHSSNKASGKNAPGRPTRRLSLTYLYYCYQRFLIMIGLNPRVSFPYPMTGPMAEQFPFVRAAIFLWYYLLYPFIAVTLIKVLFRRDVRLMNLLAIPFGVFVLYALIHAIPRHQVPPFAALAASGGVGAAFALEYLRSGKKRGEESPCSA